MDDAARVKQLEAELRQAREEIGAWRQREFALLGDVERQTQARVEAQEQQAATAEILRVIASSPTDLQRVLDAIVESANHLGEADVTSILQVEGSRLRIVAATQPEYVGGTQSFGRGSVSGRAMLDRVTIHAYESEPEYRAKYPDSQLHKHGCRWQLVIPLLREGTPLGNLVVHRRERRLFTERQVKTSGDVR